MDVNADGLPDRVYVRDNNIYVKYNTGNGFSLFRQGCSKIEKGSCDIGSAVSHICKQVNPYAVSDLSGTNNDYLQWYDNGNLCYRSNQVEYFYWTEDNRMQAYYNYQTKTAAHYRYNASGERDLKLVGEVIDANINGRYIKMPYYDRATLYASNLMLISPSL